MPVTIHAIDEDGFLPPSNGPGIGILVRWQGHFQQENELPRTGWQRLGALGWFRRGKSDGQVYTGLQMLGRGGGSIDTNYARAPSLGTP